MTKVSLRPDTVNPGIWRGRISRYRELIVASPDRESSDRGPQGTWRRWILQTDPVRKQRCFDLECPQDLVPSEAWEMTFQEPVVAMGKGR